MNWNEYVDWTHVVAKYPTDRLDGLDYLILKLNGEVGEYLHTSSNRDRELELGDICWYVARIANVIGIDLDVMWKQIKDNYAIFTIEESDLSWIVSQIAEHTGKMIRRGQIEGDLQKVQTLLFLVVVAVYDIIYSQHEGDLEGVLVANKNKLTDRLTAGTISDETKR